MYLTIILCWVLCCIYGLVRCWWINRCTQYWIAEAVEQGWKRLPSEIPSWTRMFGSFWHWRKNFASWQ